MSAFRPDGWTTPELAQAVERGQLELHYQPVVDLRSGGIVGAEALLRWRHPTLGLLPPGQFLPVVESSGLMPEIGAWVLGEACRQMRDWRMLAWRPFRLAVNVSASQVGPDFDGWVKGVLADAELPAEYLEIELTESVAFGDPAIFPALDALRQIGVRFAADDFGTGYSCLQHLKCCPISTLKIDQSFVAGLANDRRDQTIVHTVIQLAHGLGMDVVAEGVETSASLDLLRQADCDTGQGFLFAKPMPAAAFAVFVSQWRGATMNASDSTTTSCCVCCKEIPLDAAFTPEGAEYVEHFCGLECYQRFEARQDATDTSASAGFDQNPERQLEQIQVDKVFTDKASGKDTRRPELERLLAFVREGDTVVVHSMDRLARNLDDLRRLVQGLTQRGVRIEFLKEHLTFTGEDSPMANLMLSVMGAFAEFERALIRERQREGIALAKQRGAYRGRKKSLSSERIAELRQRVEAGEQKTKLAREFGISRETLYQYLRTDQ
jgi:EAL domain-containing protein (putative c-di-GMP-specific phosphodiesterase class I)/DNA invertase Pin-like site-specific DNA recombinase